MLRIGTAGWTIPTHHASLAPGSGTHLERYAQVFSCAEINSSFYRSHRIETWQRWAQSVPADFRFSVKFPKAFTHIARLSVASAMLDTFFLETAALGDKLGPILVQLPPSLRFDDCPAAEFFKGVRDRWHGPIALEPRHASWFTQAASELLLEHRISRAAGHPSRDPNSDPKDGPQPAGWIGLAYFRLHGSPRTYYSSYEAPYLDALAKAVADVSSGAEIWVIFDNTALGHAFANAMDLQDRLSLGKGK
jgi:uncharacterized protein YecE (DUF72 family)